MFDWSTRIERYRMLPEQVQTWYDSEAPAQLVDVLIDELQLRESNRAVFLAAVGDTALGLIPPDALPAYMHDEIRLPEQLAKVVAEHMVKLLAEAHILKSKEGPVSREDAPKVVGYANVPRPAPARPSTPPAVPPYRKPLTDTPRYDNRGGDDSSSAQSAR